jgi:hypothetical protein
MDGKVGVLNVGLELRYIGVTAKRWGKFWETRGVNETGMVEYVLHNAGFGG